MSFWGFLKHRTTCFFTRNGPPKLYGLCLGNLLYLNLLVNVISDTNGCFVVFSKSPFLCVLSVLLNKKKKTKNVVTVSKACHNTNVLANCAPLFHARMHHV